MGGLEGTAALFFMARTREPTGGKEELLGSPEGLVVNSGETGFAVTFVGTTERSWRGSMLTEVKTAGSFRLSDSAEAVSNGVEVDSREGSKLLTCAETETSPIPTCIRPF